MKLGLGRDDISRWLERSQVLGGNQTKQGLLRIATLDLVSKTGYQSGGASPSVSEGERHRGKTKIHQSVCV